MADIIEWLIVCVFTMPTRLYRIYSTELYTVMQYQPSPLNVQMNETQGCIRCGQRVPVEEARSMHPFAADAEARRGSTDRYILVNTPPAAGRNVQYRSSYYEGHSKHLRLPWKFPISQADCNLKRCEQSSFGTLVKRVGDINGDGFPGTRYNYRALFILICSTCPFHSVFLSVGFAIIYSP